VRSPAPALLRRFGRNLIPVIPLSAVFVAVILILTHRAATVDSVLAESGIQSPASPDSLWPISIDYPEDGSIFPPGITPPTMLWRDPSAAEWIIEIAFGDKSTPILIRTRGERMHIGVIDKDCVSDTNEPPRLTAQQAASWTWKPDAATWETIQAHSVSQPATITISGYREAGIIVSKAQAKLSTSSDPVGAPIFYRDVPLMPSQGANGTVQPLSPESIHLIRWRLRDIRQTESRTVLTGMPTCANCHSFSRDGKTMGIDVDGPANDKGLYAVVPVQRHISIQNKDVIQWNKNGQPGTTRVGFMSQVSPDGRTVVSTFAGPSLDVPRTYYITNFKDYRFLQVFFPTRGILEWYNRETGKREPLPGADDPHYVQTDGVWSPDGKTIVFARAEAKDPYRPGQKPALHANDPNETQIQYDLYRIPFNDGQGGTPEPIVGASGNGMSNSFPKVSPDGKWIVFVQCRNGQLMRPDSQLYIVPFAGGQARRLRANTSLMNSWHSFSPDGRWLVFSSKARSPYTQMYLTHLDQEGNSSPAILIDDATAANRAVNLPEFVNIAGDGIQEIQVPAVELYKLIDQATHLEEQGDNKQALAVWKSAALIDAENATVQNGLGVALYVQGETQQAFEHLRHSIRLNPIWVENHFVLGKFLLEQGRPQEAISELQTAVTLKPQFASAQESLAGAYQALGNWPVALRQWRKAEDVDPNRTSAMLGTAWLLATAPDAAVRNGDEAVRLAEQASAQTPTSDPNTLDILAAAYAEKGDFSRASDAASRALDLAVTLNQSALANAIQARKHLYAEQKPFRESKNSAASLVQRGQPTAQLHP
jgi:tetratricopeptide (TPR) repeat protein